MLFSWVGLLINWHNIVAMFGSPHATDGYMLFSLLWYPGLIPRQSVGDLSEALFCYLKFFVYISIKTVILSKNLEGASLWDNDRGHYVIIRNLWIIFSADYGNQNDHTEWSHLGTQDFCCIMSPIQGLKYPHRCCRQAVCPAHLLTNQSTEDSAWCILDFISSTHVGTLVSAQC
jgi:hypothetical protein